MKKQKNKTINLKTIFQNIYKLRINDILVEAGGVFFFKFTKE